MGYTAARLKLKFLVMLPYWKPLWGDQPESSQMMIGAVPPPVNP